MKTKRTRGAPLALALLLTLTLAALGLLFAALLWLLAILMEM